MREPEATVSARLTPTRRPAPSSAAVVGFVVVLAGLTIGLRALHDNSFFTHLTTGRLMWDSGHIPHSDPYSFTASGHDWVVQSWVPSFVYGGIDRLAGVGGLVVLTGLLVATAAGLLWALSRPAESLLGRLLLVAPSLAVGMVSYGPRPLMFGLILFSVALLAGEGRIDARWLIPGYWLWVNSHGSWPLGLLALGLLALGRHLDKEDPSVELRALRYAAIGTLVAAINPLGPRLLVFPIELLRRQNVLHSIIEWASPTFDRLDQRSFLAVLVLAIVLLTRRPSWRTALPMAVFAALALLSLRNMAMAGVMLVVTTAPALRGVGSLSGRERRSIHRPMVVALGALVVLMLASAPRGDDGLELVGYPTAAVQFGLDHDLINADARVMAADYVGNYLELQFDGEVPVFIDDRYDMYPDAVIDDYETLLQGEPSWHEVLERWSITVVVWRVDKPLAQYLELSDGWSVEYRDEDWMVAVPR